MFYNVKFKFVALNFDKNSEKPTHAFIRKWANIFIQKDTHSKLSLQNNIELMTHYNPLLEGQIHSQS